MNRGLIIIGLVILGIALFVGGLFFGASRWNMMGYQSGGMMANENSDGQASGMMGQGMMNQGMMGQGMMNGGMMNGGMMNGGMMNGGMMGSGMMNGGMMGPSATGDLYGVDPLSLEEAQTAVTDYLAGLEQSNLVVGEVIVFDNHAYAQIIEQDTNIGAFEVLVDPVTLAITPEHGPAMMWNAKYSSMSGMGMMGAMMENSAMPGGMMSGNTIEPSADMPVAADEALEAAQRYLDTYLPDSSVGETADSFYGYYTAHILRNGEVIGLLSINGYTGQVIAHSGHGSLLNITEDNR